MIKRTVWLALLALSVLSALALAGPDPCPGFGDRNPKSHRDGDACTTYEGLAGCWAYVLDPHAGAPNRSPDDCREKHPYLWECRPCPQPPALAGPGAPKPKPHQPKPAADRCTAQRDSLKCEAGTHPVCKEWPDDRLGHQCICHCEIAG